MRALWIAMLVGACSLTTGAVIPAYAAGGAHVIDDAAVETPGTCHLESWVTTSSGKAGLVNSAPACTREAWPNLEIGGFVTHGWAPNTDDTVIGLSPKLLLRSEQTGLGIGIATSLGYGVDRGRLETASAIVPMTIPAGKHLRLNFNAGWQWFRSTDSHDLFVGAQAEFALRPNLTLMAEGFTRDRGKMGGQAGLRWTPCGGSVDVDLLAGRYLDGATRNAITFGVTLRH